MNDPALLFLDASGWSGAEVMRLAGDAGTRQYYRLRRSGRTAILMKDEDVSDFARIAKFLKETGLRPPNIIAEDPEGHFLLLQDFGDTRFSDAVARGERADDIYGCAVDVLIHLRSSAPEPEGIPSYESGHVHAGRDKVVTWYMPAVKEQEKQSASTEDYLAVWDGIEKSLPSCPQGFVHVDFHLDNLMWMPEEEGLRRCGILDFQGARRGPLPYDLGNLLEDARRDVSPEIKAAMIEKYCAGMDAEEQKAFMAWYRVVTTQFHCRVIGQFVELAVRHGKDDYMMHIPRVQKYIREALQEAVLRPLRDWFVAQKIDFDEPVPSPEEAREIWNT